MAVLQVYIIYMFIIYNQGINIPEIFNNIFIA